jgi:nicotinamide mononucleotide (NMN) deamidase PncC
LLSDVSLQYYSTSTTIGIWIAGSSGTGVPTWTPPDGSAVITAPSGACGSTSSHLHDFTGLSSTTKYYFVIYYNVVTQTFQNYTNIYSVAPTAAQVAAALADGTIVAVVASAASGSGITPGGGYGGVPGGGGKVLR